jgi:hypothetical protein
MTGRPRGPTRHSMVRSCCTSGHLLKVRTVFTRYLRVPLWCTVAQNDEQIPWISSSYHHGRWTRFFFCHNADLEHLTDYYHEVVIHSWYIIMLDIVDDADHEHPLRIPRVLQHLRGPRGIESSNALVDEAGHGSASGGLVYENPKGVPLLPGARERILKLCVVRGIYLSQDSVVPI